MPTRACLMSAAIADRRHPLLGWCCCFSLDAQCMAVLCCVLPKSESDICDSELFEGPWRWCVGVRLYCAAGCGGVVASTLLVYQQAINGAAQCLHWFCDLSCPLLCRISLSSGGAAQASCWLTVLPFIWCVQQFGVVSCAAGAAWWWWCCCTLVSAHGGCLPKGHIGIGFEQRGARALLCV